MNSAAEAFCILTLAAFGASGLADAPVTQASIRSHAEPSLLAAQSFVTSASKLVSTIRTELRRACDVSIPDDVYSDPGHKAWPAL
jgi:hypothetical protein